MPLDPLLFSTAVEAVLGAGVIQMAHLGTGVRVDKKGAIDLVTEIDLEVERRFRELIRQRFPDHVILAEEGEGATRPDDEVESGTGPPGCCWLFDPIDGTTNYAHGLPIFAASAALEIDGRIMIGAVYDPVRRELFTAERGVGSFLNGSPLHVSRCEVLLDALLCTGFPYDVHETVDEIVGLFGSFVGRARAVRRLGSAALDLCYVAAGRLDGFWEQRLSPWDTAAAALVVEEAGGVVTGFDARPFEARAGSVVASNDRLHGVMLDVIHGFYANRSRNATD